MAAQSGKRKFRDMVRDFTSESDIGVCCEIEGKCKYVQKKYDAGNFVRHFRSAHFKLAKQNRFFKDDKEKEEKHKQPNKISVAITEDTIVESCLKLVTMRNLPLQSIDWPEVRAILGPLGDSLGCTFSSIKTKGFVKITAAKILETIAQEMRGKLVSLKIDSASRHGRHILGINALFIKEDQFALRTRGVCLTRMNNVRYLFLNLMIPKFEITKYLIFKLHVILSLFRYSRGKK